MTGAGSRWLVAVSLVLSAVGCGLFPHDARILQVAVSADDPAQVDLEVDSCNADLAFDVTESAAEVVVTVTARGDTTDDCADLVVVQLERPLGDRVLIDGSRGEPVAVQRAG